jgi:hypothetical protein
MDSQTGTRREGQMDVQTDR